MLHRPRLPSIADQVSSSLQDPSMWSSPQNIERTNDNTSDTSSKAGSERDERQDESSSKESQQAQSAVHQEQHNLPSLVECLYGSATKKSPFIPDDDVDDVENEDDEISNDGGDENNDDEIDEGLNVSIEEDELGLNSRWSQNPGLRSDYHDIDMTILRKLCSQGSGIPEDEGPRGIENDGYDNDDPDLQSNSNTHMMKIQGTCHRGIAWRVLLETLPVRDIHATWPKDIPPQRKLYRELVEKYMRNAIDPGRKLKGETHWQQSLRMKKNSSNNLSTDDNDKKDHGKRTFETEEQQSEKPTIETSTAAPPALENDRKSRSVSNEFDYDENIRATEDIYDVFPATSKYKELWRKCGITLNQGESAAAIGMNILKVPEELLSQDSEDSSEKIDTTKDDETDKGDISNTGSNDKNFSDANFDNVSIAGGTVKRSKKDDLFDQFCKDAKLLSEIRKDVVRTNPHLRFYLETHKNLGIRRHAALERILFVWAKLNENLYVQGMNEIVGTMYYVLAMDPTRSNKSNVGGERKRQCSWADHAEADTYYLFHSLMIRMEVRDVFVADLDHDGTSGLHARIANIEDLLQKHDPDVFHHLRDHLGIDSSFYVIRWLTTLLSREFLLPDTIRLWDSLLASTHKENFLRYVCACMVMAARDRLLRSDFGTCLKLLQNYPSGEIGMDELLESSRALWIYETQISLACGKGNISLRKAMRVIPPPSGLTMAFGRVGPKPLRLTAVVSPTSTENTSDMKLGGNIMGAAKRLWRWGTPSGKENKEEKEDNGKEIEDEDEEVNQKDLEAWDLIDNIIDGKTEFISSSMASVSSPPSIYSPTEQSTYIVRDREQLNNSNIDDTTVASHSPSPSPIPQASPLRFWIRSRSDTTPTTTPLIDQSKLEVAPASAPSRLWNRSSTLATTTPPQPMINVIASSSLEDDDNVVDEFSNNHVDPIRNRSNPYQTSTNIGFWDRIRRGSSV